MKSREHTAIHDGIIAATSQVTASVDLPSPKSKGRSSDTSIHQLPTRRRYGVTMRAISVALPPAQKARFDHANRRVDKMEAQKR